MAATDYEIRGSGSFASTAVLGADVAPLDDTFPLANLRTANGDVRVIGEGIMIGREIVRLVEIGIGYIRVARGCADTIPQAHLAGTLMYFYEDAIGTDQREYAMGQTITVKVLPHLSSTGAVPVSAAPPNPITFVGRFGRPYPPGKLQIDGDPWFQPFLLDMDHRNAVLTLATRNRVTQSDQLIDHMVGNITPEEGTTYRARLFTSEGELKATVNLGTTPYTINWNDMLATFDFPPSNELVPVYMLIDAMRDGLASMQAYRVDIMLLVPGPTGYGFNYGFNYGQDYAQAYES